MPFVQLQQALPAIADRVYLNTGTSGPIPTAAFSAVSESFRRLVDEGFASPPVMSAYMETLAQARSAASRVLGCDADDVALTQSTTDGIAIVANGLDWQSGDEVIISDLEHISGIGPWIDLSHRVGISVQQLSSRDGHLDIDDFRAAMTPRTRLICVSHVSYTTGTLLPLKDICDLAKQTGAHVLVDGAQSAGQVPLDVEDLGCDFYAISGQKWLLGPEGTGALYVSPKARQSLAPTRIGWSSLTTDDVSDNILRFHPGARRYESSTMHAPAFAGLTTSIQLLESIGWERIRDRAVALSRIAAEQLAALSGVTVLSPPATPTGLLTFRVEAAEGESVVKSLWKKRRIVIRTIPSLGALRASFHAFNTEEDVEALVEEVRAIIKNSA